MIKALAIDIDDTLTLTEAACFDMENATLSRMGRVPMSRETHLQTWGKPLFEIITTRSPGIDVEEFKAVYHPTLAEYIDEGKLDVIPDENFRALDKLMNLGVMLLALTSRTHGELQHMLAPDHLLAERIKAFYYRDTMEFHKPDPRAFNELLAENNLKPEDCAYVGDSVGDGIASNQAGLYFIASLESGLRQREDFDAADVKVDAYINRFPEVVEVACALGK